MEPFDIIDTYYLTSSDEGPIRGGEIGIEESADSAPEIFEQFIGLN